MLKKFFKCVKKTLEDFCKFRVEFDEILKTFWIKNLRKFLINYVSMV